MSRRPRSCFAAATFDLLFEVNYILAISFSQRRSSSHVHVCAAPWMGPFGVIPELKEEGALPSRGLVAYLVRFLKKKILRLISFTRAPEVTYTRNTHTLSFY